MYYAIGSSSNSGACVAPPFAQFSLQPSPSCRSRPVLRFSCTEQDLVCRVYCILPFFLSGVPSTPPDFLSASCVRQARAFVSVPPSPHTGKLLFGTSTFQQPLAFFGAIVCHYCHHQSHHCFTARSGPAILCIALRYISL